MVKFNKMGNSNFPHISNVDTHKYDNVFDYSRYNTTQMKLQICSVPWDMGEAHIGARTISGIGNVVHFGYAADRDKWFESIPDTECYRFETKYKELHSAGYVDVPMPFDMCAKHNYLVVEYELFANSDFPVEYEGENGVRKWFYFIREVEFKAPNTTRLHLMEDAWQTWIYDVKITGMVLERGHAPMSAVTASEYLSNPVGKCDYLLTEDVNFGDARIVKHTDAIAFNSGDMYACIATSADPRLGWGTKAGDNWHVPAKAHYTIDGVPSYLVFALDADDLNTLLAYVTSNIPQFKQTIQAIWFIDKSLVTAIADFTFAGVSCHILRNARKQLELIDIDKSLFGYPAKYADIAKLYTSPYAHIEITDEHGDVDIIKIEDTTGTINASVACNLVYPTVRIDAHLLGIGGSTSHSITFKNISSKTFTFSGAWYETIKSWDVPTFAVVLDPASEYDYSTHFDRKQRVVDYTTDYDNATASASAGKNNADASANAAQTNTTTLAAAAKGNADANADTLVSNTLLQTTANTAITSRSNAAAVSDATLTNALSQALQAWEAGYARQTANNQVNAEYASAAIGAAGGAIGSAISGAATGASMGPAGAAAGAIGGLVSGAISGATSIAQTAVAANLTTTQAEATVSLSQSKVNETSQSNNDRTTNQNSANTENVGTSNTASTGASANSAATTKANATRTQSAQNTAAALTNSTELANNTRLYNAETANAGRSRDRAISAIDNDILQAALNAPSVYGDFSNGDTATTRPMALFANIVTQDRNAIRCAGDEFLRYGYMYDGQWDFDGNWNVMPHFTYWKLKDFWVSNLQVPDMYMDRLRFFLFGGVTVWRNPGDIGNITIYEN